MTDDIAEMTIKHGFVAKRSKYHNKSPLVVLLFTPPPSKKISTGYGRGSFDVLATQETIDACCGGSGHGRVMAVPQTALDSALAVSLLIEST